MLRRVYQFMFDEKDNKLMFNEVNVLMLRIFLDLAQYIYISHRSKR